MTSEPNRNEIALSGRRRQVSPVRAACRRTYRHYPSIAGHDPIRDPLIPLLHGALLWHALVAWPTSDRPLSAFPGIRRYCPD
jgi:hypothetical protein